jgi:hypothetical protein
MRGDIRRVLGMATGCLLAALAHSGSPTQRAHPDPGVHQEIVRKPDVYIETYVTGYNTVATQTDGTPCIGAAGTYICGRNDVVACPPFLKLGTAVEISGKRYVCEDRTSRKYRGRFDINCDQDKSCPFKVASWTTVKVLFE